MGTIYGSDRTYNTLVKHETGIDNIFVYNLFFVLDNLERIYSC